MFVKMKAIDLHAFITATHSLLCYLATRGAVIAVNPQENIACFLTLFSYSLAVVEIMKTRG